MRASIAPATLGAALLAIGLLTGCTDSGDSPGTPAQGDVTAQPTPADPTTSSSPETTASSPASASSPADPLVPTAAVPGLKPGWQWQEGETGPAGTDPFGVCAKVDLASIGATDVLSRTYFPPDDSDDNAAQQVAEFPDANTAARAWAVLKSWHDKCAQKAADHPGLKVGALSPVAVPSGSARWYLSSWRPAGEETDRFETLGMVLAGTRIAVLRMDHSGRDHRYPAGHDPMVPMVTAAADRLR
jgi:hypothetical protein